MGAAKWIASGSNPHVTEDDLPCLVGSIVAMDAFECSLCGIELTDVIGVVTGRVPIGDWDGPRYRVDLIEPPAIEEPFARPLHNCYFYKDELKPFTGNPQIYVARSTEDLYTGALIRHRPTTCNACGRVIQSGLGLCRRDTIGRVFCIAVDSGGICPNQLQSGCWTWATDKLLKPDLDVPLLPHLDTGPIRLI